MAKKWFQVAAKRHTGWRKDDSLKARLRNTIASRPKSWSYNKRVLSAGRSLIALSNVTKNRETKIKAKMDAKRLFNKLKSKK